MGYYAVFFQSKFNRKPYEVVDDNVIDLLSEARIFGNSIIKPLQANNAKLAEIEAEQLRLGIDELILVD